MPTEFYDVKSREKVQIEDADLRKKKYEKNGNVRYAFRATYNGTNLTKFVKEADWKASSAPEED